MSAGPGEFASICGSVCVIGASFSFLSMIGVDPNFLNIVFGCLHDCFLYELFDEDI